MSDVPYSTVSRVVSPRPPGFPASSMWSVPSELLTFINLHLFESHAWVLPLGAEDVLREQHATLDGWVLQVSPVHLGSDRSGLPPGS